MASVTFWNQASQNGAQIEATVESILGLSEVAMGVLGEVEGVVGTTEGERLRLPRYVLIALNCGNLVLALPPPVTTRS